eukprot:gene9788-biopygen681
MGAHVTKARHGGIVRGAHKAGACSLPAMPLLWSSGQNHTVKGGGGYLCHPKKLYFTTGSSVRVK